MDVSCFASGTGYPMRAPHAWVDAMPSCAPPIAPKPRPKVRPNLKPKPVRVCVPPPKRASLDGLPDELKLQVLHHTGPNPFVLATMQLVSRDWRRLAQDDSLWEPLYPRALAHGPSEIIPLPKPPQRPQARLAGHIEKSNHLRRLFFRELWSGRDKPATLKAGSYDAIFACHAALALGPGWAARQHGRLHIQARARTHALMHDSIWIPMPQLHATADA